MNREEAISTFGLNPNHPIVAVIGGSQGSAALNRIVSESLDYLTDTLSTQVIWQTGPAHFETLRHFKTDVSSVRIYPFVEQMEMVYAAADLVVSRAGALTLSEIAFCGKPSLLVPLPHATADHQTKNAESLRQAGAAIVIAESELSRERFTQEVKTLVTDKERLDRMGKAAKSLSKAGSADRIVDQIVELVEK